MIVDKVSDEGRVVSIGAFDPSILRIGRVLLTSVPTLGWDCCSHGACCQRVGRRLPELAGERF